MEDFPFLKLTAIVKNIRCFCRCVFMIPVQVRFTKKLIEMLDQLVEQGVYSNRSEAVRDATRKLVLINNDSAIGERRNRVTEIK